MKTMRSNSKNVVTVAVGLMLILVAWRILSLGLADHWARANPQRALVWRPDHSEALFRMAEKHAEAKDCRLAKHYAERALKSNLLDGRPIRVLAFCSERSGDGKKALALYTLASEHAPRDVPSHLWLFTYALNQRRAEMAVLQLHALLTLKPALFNLLKDQLNVLAANPEVQPYLVTQLAGNPSWRTSFLNSLAVSKQPIDLIAPLYTQLGQKSELEPSEFLPWVRRLKSENRSFQAYVTWANLIPESQRKYLGNIFDGGFELPLESQIGVFSWTSKPINGAHAQLSSTSGTIGENSYYVEFEGRRTAFANLSQSLALPPGSWRFSFRAKSDGLSSPKGLIWRIICENDGRVLADSEPMHGRFGWKEIVFGFDVPETCAGQRAILMIPARIAAESSINGSLWLDSILIQPEERPLN